MTIVLMILAVLSIAGGWIGWPAALGGGFPTPFQRWLEPVLLPLGAHKFHFHEASKVQELGLMALSVSIAFVGIILAGLWYWRDAAWRVPAKLAQKCASAPLASRICTMAMSSSGYSW